MSQLAYNVPGSTGHSPPPRSHLQSPQARPGEMGSAAELSGREAAFRRRLALLEEKHCALWRSTSALPPSLGEPTARRDKRRAERATERFVDGLEKELASQPAGEPGRARLRGWLHRSLRGYGRRGLGLPAPHCDVIFSDAFFRVTAEFARGARAFDPTVALHDLSQALRNVWVMHLFQLFLELEVTHSPAVLGYSLLYPYTDNFLDDDAVSAAAKQRFDQQLGRRLRGEHPPPGSDHERAVFALVGKIERQYPRAEYCELHQSLLAIHRAQRRSLEQQAAGELDDASLLAASVAKGGASVLADGYLVAGRLSREEADFFFGYGVFLQLIDDLQDVRQDLEAGHETLFTRAARGGTLDDLTSRLCHFLDAVLAGSRRFADRRFGVLKDIARSQCRQLILQAAAQHRRLYSRRYVRRLEPCSLVRFSYVRRRGRKLFARYLRLDEHLRRSGGLGSLFEALG